MYFYLIYKCAVFLLQVAAPCGEKGGRCERLYLLCWVFFSLLGGVFDWGGRERKHERCTRTRSAVVYLLHCGIQVHKADDNIG